MVNKALRGIPNYLTNLKKQKVHLFRRYNVVGKTDHWYQFTIKNLEKTIISANRELAEIDICLLRPFANFIGLFLLIDCNSRFLWYHPIKSKKKDQVFAALDAILKQSGSFQRVVSDGKYLRIAFHSVLTIFLINMWSIWHLKILLWYF